MYGCVHACSWFTSTGGLVFLIKYLIGPSDVVEMKSRCFQSPVHVLLIIHTMFTRKHLLSIDISLRSRGVIWPSLIICTIMNPVSLTYFTQTNCLHNRDVTIARCNISWHCIQRCRDRDGTSIRVTTHKNTQELVRVCWCYLKKYWPCCNSTTMQMLSHWCRSMNGMSMCKQTQIINWDTQKKCCHRWSLRERRHALRVISGSFRYM